MSPPLYSSPDKRFYVRWSRRDAMFHICDMNRCDWRILCPDLVSAIGVCERYYKEASDG